MSKRVALTVGSREISAITGKPAPSYRELWELVVDGKLSAVQQKGRWYLDPRQAAKELDLLAKNAA